MTENQVNPESAGQSNLYDFNPDGEQVKVVDDSSKISTEAVSDTASLFDSNAAAPENWLHKSGQAGSVFESFYHAFNGLALGFRQQRNLRIHTILGLLVFALAFYLKVEPWQWIALSVAIGFVFFAEFVNTAIEHMVDIQANYRYHLSARYAKDTAAAAVLVAAITAVIVGAIVFLPRLCSLVTMGII
ncbi:diacylglycerol kinase family protein [bacterium]|nr:diacylglycerol kinase family protein [bacterium]MBP9092681.1 diacylglycerol kinase family protein [bacterium]MBP9810137.1 diacylglycerol kinase family protein [bacterium]